MKKKRQLNILDLPFISILDKRPNNGDFILMAWDILGRSGYETIYWDTNDVRCQHAVAWLRIPLTHVYTRNCGVVLSYKAKTKRPLLAWSKHYSVLNNSNNYQSLDKMPRRAHVEQSKI